MWVTIRVDGATTITCPRDAAASTTGSGSALGGTSRTWTPDPADNARRTSPPTAWSTEAGSGGRIDTPPSAATRRSGVPRRRNVASRPAHRHAAHRHSSTRSASGPAPVT